VSIRARSRARIADHLGALVLLAAIASGAFAQPYDVPYVPTPQVVVDEMLRLAEVTAHDFVIDLGCGDGRIPITAAAYFGARAHGVDIDPGRIAESHVNAKAAGVTHRVSFERANLFDIDISRASVVTMYLLPEINLKLRPRLLATLKPGTRIVSHDFSMDDWKPDRVLRIQKNMYLWIIPANVQGRWRTEVNLPGVGIREYELELRQKFQEVDAYARGDKRNYAVWEPQLRGSELNFVIVDGDLAHRFEGKVEGRAIEGIVRTGAGSAEVQTPFRATYRGAL
jgi:SAM-dependent methyltransferase